MDSTTRDNITSLLDLPLEELVGRANSVRKEFAGSDFETCNIINAKSGSCDQDCKFCAQSARYKVELDVHGLKSKEEIVEAAQQAKKIGAARFGIVTSGNRLLSDEVDLIIRAVREIQSTAGIEVCASLGALPKVALEDLKSAGLSRYHHNIETSSRYYPLVVSTHPFQERIDTIKAAKEAGLEVCSGGIIGMGETWQDRIDMAYLLKDLNVDSVPINILVPIKGTPFGDLPVISGADAVKTICLFRIVLKDKIIKIAAGRETVLKDFQVLGFMAGATGMLIGGYLTVKARSLEEDYRLIEEVKKLWNQ